MDDFVITANNGKTYNSIRAYHIALGHAVRQALLKFAKEVEEKCQEKVENFYAEYDPEYYQRSYQLKDKMMLNQLIKIKVVGNFQANYIFEYNLFDSSVLDSFKEEGQLGTYMSFDESESKSEIESYLQKGIYGHTSFDLYKEIDKYIEDNLDKRVQKILDEF